MAPKIRSSGRSRSIRIRASGLAHSGAPVCHSRPRLALYSLTTPAAQSPLPRAYAGKSGDRWIQSLSAQTGARTRPSFGVTETFANEVTFLSSRVEEGRAGRAQPKLTAQVRYQCCNDKQCLPPKRKTAAGPSHRSSRPGGGNLDSGRLHEVPETRAGSSVGLHVTPAPHPRRRPSPAISGCSC